MVHSTKNVKMKLIKGFPLEKESSEGKRRMERRESEYVVDMSSLFARWRFTWCTCCQRLQSFPSSRHFCLLFFGFPFDSRNMCKRLGWWLEKHSSFRDLVSPSLCSVRRKKSAVSLSHYYPCTLHSHFSNFTVLQYAIVIGLNFFFHLAMRASSNKG